MQKISSQFKYTMDLGVSSTKSTFKLRKTRKDTIVSILIIVFIVLMAGMLIWDIKKDNNFVLDLIILIALVLVGLFSLIMPLIIIHTQKTFLRKIDLNNIEYTITEIVNDKCTETFYKDNKIVMQNVSDMNSIAGYEIKGQYLFLVFNSFACAIFDTNTLNISLQEFIEFINTRIEKNKLIKK